MLGQGRRQWASIKTTLSQSVITVKVYRVEVIVTFYSSPTTGNRYNSFLEPSQETNQIIWVAMAAVNTRHWNNTGLMLGQNHRRLPNIKPTLFQSLRFVTVTVYDLCCCNLWRRVAWRSNMTAMEVKVNCMASFLGKCSLWWRCLWGWCDTFSL